MNPRATAQLLGGAVLVYAVVTGVRTGAPTRPGGGSSNAALVEGESSPPTAGQSGSRLKGHYLEGADGSRQFVGWHDTMLDVDCSYTLAADGAWRCLPDGANADKYFTDAFCTRPLAMAPKGCGTPSYALFTNSYACGQRTSTRVFKLGAPFTGPVVYRADYGGCAGFNSADLVLADLYSIGDEMPLSSFVQARWQMAQ